MGIFNVKKETDGTIKVNIINYKKEVEEEPEDEEEEDTICFKCKHHSVEGKYAHNCYAGAERNYVTGETLEEDCEDKNDGYCDDYESLKE